MDLTFIFVFRFMCTAFFSHVNKNVVPKWGGELEDENVNHLIRDILHDCVNRKAWDLLKTSVRNRTKHKEFVPMNRGGCRTNF